MSKDEVEIVTVWIGNEAATYIASEFAKLGTKAAPLRTVVSPYRDGKMPTVELEQVDTIVHSTEKPLDTNTLKVLLRNKSHGWNLDVLRKLVGNG